MKKSVTNITLLIILLVLPILPGYLQLLNQLSNPPLIICTEDGTYKKVNILKGRFSELEKFLTNSLENNSENNKTPFQNVLNRSIDLFIYILPSKIDINIFPILIDKNLNSKILNKESFYLNPTSPPPQLIS